MKTVEFIKNMTMEEMEKMFSAFNDHIIQRVADVIQYRTQEEAELQLVPIKTLMKAPRLSVDPPCRFNEGWLKNTEGFTKDSPISNNYEYVKNEMSTDELATMLSVLVTDAIRHALSKIPSARQEAFDYDIYTFPMRGLKGRREIREWLESEVK